MNAVLIRRPNPRGGYPVTYLESDEMDEDFSGLRADVRNLHVHVVYLKAGVDALNRGIEFLREKLEQYRFEGITRSEAARLETKAEIGALRTETKVEFGTVRAEIGALRAETKAEFKEVRAEMKSEFAAVRTEMADFRKSLQAQIDKLAEKLDTAKGWAVGLYLTGMGLLLGVMAHGFKWI